MIQVVVRAEGFALVFDSEADVTALISQLNTLRNFKREAGQHYPGVAVRAKLLTDAERISDQVLHAFKKPRKGKR